MTIQHVAKTRDGEILLKIKETSKGAAATSSETLKNKRPDIGGEIRRLPREATIVIRGLDATVAESEV